MGCVLDYCVGSDGLVCSGIVLWDLLRILGGALWGWKGGLLRGVGKRRKSIGCEVWGMLSLVISALRDPASWRCKYVLESPGLVCKKWPGVENQPQAAVLDFCEFIASGAQRKPRFWGI